MKYSVVLSLVATCAYAQVGPSGIIDPSGRNIQFSHAFADNVAVIGPSGIVSADGNNVQLTPGQADLHNARRKRSPQLLGPSGYISADGQLRQFKTGGVEVLLDGPSGIVLGDGQLIQKRSKRSPQLLGPSGYISEDGQQVQFATGGVEVLLDGPSGIVLGDGQLLQKRGKRSTFGMIHGAQVGAGQLMTPAGVPHLFALGTKVAAAGPSGVVLTDGQNIQYSRKKRSAFGIHHGAQIGAAQFMTPAGVPHLLNDGTKVASAGPSGIVLTNGQNIQYPARKKRSAAFGIHHGAQIGAAQFMTPAGVPHLLNDGTKVASAGPSGIVLTNGQNIQYPA